MPKPCDECHLAVSEEAPFVCIAEPLGEPSMVDRQGLRWFIAGLVVIALIFLSLALGDIRFLAK